MELEVREEFTKTILDNIIKKDARGAYNRSSEERTHTICVWNGKIFLEPNQICYQHLSFRENVSELVVFHPFEEFFNEEYTQWLLNSSLFGKCFITKDAKQGFEYGWEINLEEPWDHVLAALAALRLQFEAGKDGMFSWPEFYKMTRSPVTAMYLQHQYKIVGGYLYNNDFNNGHEPLPRQLKLSEYKPKNRKKGGKPSNKTLSIYFGSFKAWGYGYGKDNRCLINNLSQKFPDMVVETKGMFGETAKTIVATRKNILKICEYLKGLG